MKRHGFTIIELLIAMGLFAILISVVSGIFVRSLRAQRVTVALIAANNNASLAIEQMAREIRTGQSFSAVIDQLRFINAKGETVTYRWNDTDQTLEPLFADGFFAQSTRLVQAIC